MKSFDLSLLSKYRTQIMGVAAIMILLCHSNVYHVAWPDLIATIMMLGNLGVDLFLFVSGIGCYYSLSKWGGQNLCDWYKIRLKRIALPYAIYFCMQCVIFALLGILDFKLELWNISTLGFWVDHTGTWYIALLLPLYILTPFLYKLLDTGDLKRWMIAISICVTLTIINHPSMNPCNEGVFSDIISNIQFAFVRVPSFVLGMSLAPYVKSSKKIDSLFTIGGMIGLTIFYHFLFRSASFEFIVVLPICMMICLICNLIKKIKIVDCVLTTLGSVSLELYLTNGTFQTAMHNIAERIDLGALARGRYFEYFMVIALGFMLSLSMQRLSSLISNYSRK